MGACTWSDGTLHRLTKLDSQFVLQDCPEKAVFDAVMVWAGYGSEVVDAASACHPMHVSSL